FHGDRTGLHEIAETIRRVVELPPDEAPPDYDPDEITEAPEGRVFTRLHRYRERNRALVDQRKQGALRASGKLACEACGFDFAQTYGPRGHGYIEAHHTKPVSTLVENATTRLEDLALLCANCHRMIHAAQPWLDLSELKAMLTT
ncbi:MAG TPA: HNH endonuclease, partial [Caulobacteraceae bacterium]